MFLRFRSVALQSVLFAAACAACSDSTPSTPVDPVPGDTVTPAGPGGPVTATDPDATALGVSIMASNTTGAPRLVRAIVPRPAVAGTAPESAAREHVANLAALWLKKQTPMALVDAGTQQLRNGATVVKLAQTVDGIPVTGGELRVLLHPDGAFAAASGTLLPANAKPTFTSNASAALEHALDQQLGASRPKLAVQEAVADATGWHTLEVSAVPGIAVSSARARRELMPSGGKLIEVWSVEVFTDAAVDPQQDASFPQQSAHQYLIADAGGKILRDRDLVQNDAFVYRAYAETTGNRRPLDGPLESFAPYPGNGPNGSSPARVPAPLVVQEAFNGPIDPWLANNATTTNGNNVEVFADLDDTSTFTPGDVRPEVKAGRILNYTYNHDLGPLATPDQSKAAAVNTFYLVNWMHDWWYDSGFTEAAGNAQQDNYGRGGVGGDRILVAAQAGANVGLRNNANMATPGDGSRPRMRMYLWTSGTVTSVETANGSQPSESFSAGSHEFDFTGELVVANDGTAPNDDGCQVPTNAAGKIVLVNYVSGSCGSAVRVNNAKAGGAVGVIIADTELDDPRAFAGSAAANIPGLAVGKTAGAALSALAAPATITLHSAISGPERDGDFDNTIVAHEWGHYLHHRLADCGAAQCGGMSEGWGDFNALLMMLREGDDRDGSYGMAGYAVNDGTPDAAYYGLRRFPYSRLGTLNKNPLTFRNIGDDAPIVTDLPGKLGGLNSEVHNTGEVWAQMLWEAVNVLADQHGVTVARRRMSDYIVTGLLLTPSDATFTEARDAILAAASAQDTEDMILLAAAFAGRGAGSCAKSPSVADTTNSGVVESGTLAGKLALGGLSLIDDGISCDHDGYLDQGESGSLKFRLANNGILAAEEITVTATSTATGIKLGAPIKIALLQPYSSSQLSIPVTLLPTAPKNTVVTINLHVTGLNTCDKTGIDLPISIRTGLDDVANASNIDQAETRLVAWTAAGADADVIWGHTSDATGNQAFFAKDAGFPSDTTFTSPALQARADQPFVVKFKHAYNLEGASGQWFDGGMIEASTDNGATWADVSTLGVNPGYTGPLYIGSDNPLGGRQAFSGKSAGYPALQTLTLDFGTQFANKTVLIRFRVGTDAAAAEVGWTIDDIEVTGISNTPFPVLTNETATCTARRAVNEASTIVATQAAPKASLEAFDRSVCILNESAE